MSNYAIYETDIILNVIVAESQEIAEEVTGKKAVLSIDGIPWIGWIFSDGEWQHPPNPPTE